MEDPLSFYFSQRKKVFPTSVALMGTEKSSREHLFGNSRPPSDGKEDSQGRFPFLSGTPHVIGTLHRSLICGRTGTQGLYSLLVPLEWCICNGSWILHNVFIKYMTLTN